MKKVEPAIALSGIFSAPIVGDHGATSSHARDSIVSMTKEEVAAATQRRNTRLSIVARRASTVARGLAEGADMGRRLTSEAIHFLSDEGTNKESKVMLKERRMSHLQKFGGGKVKKDAPEMNALNVLSPMAEAHQRGRRQTAAVVLYNAGVQKLSTKPKLKTTWDTYGGRSFLTSDWKEDHGSHVAADDVPSEDFFSFYNRTAMRDEPVKGLAMSMRPPITEEPAPAVPIGDTAKAALRKGKKALSVKPKKKKKAWFLFANLLKRKMKRGIKDKLMNQFDDRREFFTAWLSFVQTVIMIVVLCTYPFAPIGIDSEDARSEVLLSREGVLYTENLQIKVIQSFWLGPSLEDLISLGAKYAPCMRKDNKVFREIVQEQRNENATGCCMAMLSDGCIQREERDCMTPSVEFRVNKVCGQDPDHCLLASPPPAKWDRQTITSWPKCDRNAPVKHSSELRHMTCKVVGRPCCVKTQGQCVITTHDNCKFRKGIYHPEHTLCSQVDCLSATCGNKFYNDYHPDQIYRLFVPLFLNAGILHLLVTLVFNFTILRDIEGYAGWFRTFLIFMISGAAGNLWSCVLLPYQAEVGESGAMFGIFACVFVEGIQNWSNLEQPGRYVGKLAAILFVLILFGLLPMVDNYGHIFGFVYGMLLGFVVLPTIVTKDKDEDPVGYTREVRKNLAISLICLILAVGLTVLGFVLFYDWQDFHSASIAFLNCPFGEQFCENYHQGQHIESRLVEY